MSLPRTANGMKKILYWLWLERVQLMKLALIAGVVGLLAMMVLQALKERQVCRVASIGACSADGLCGVFLSNGKKDVMTLPVEGEPCEEPHP